jgi:putative membrane protein
MKHVPNAWEDFLRNDMVGGMIRIFDGKITMASANLFFETDRDEIAAAVKTAEGHTAGEIVPYVVVRSDDYEIALWRGGLSVSLLVITLLLAARVFTSGWLDLRFAQTATLILFAQGLGMLAVYFIPGLKRFFAGRELLEQCVTQRAAQAFLAEEIFKTRDRTGILIFLSLFEHKVVVMGDAGINAKVQPEDWNEVVQIIVNGMRASAPGAGLIAAIQKCGELLQRKGVARRPDDTDELQDSLRMAGR